MEEQLAPLVCFLYWKQGNNRPHLLLPVGEKQDTLSSVVFHIWLILLAPVMVSSVNLTQSTSLGKSLKEGLSRSDWPVGIFVEGCLDC